MNVSRSVRCATVAIALVVSAACTPGQRPTLVEQPVSEPLAPLEFDLPPAPVDAVPLPPAADDFTLESSVDDAILAWAIDRNVPYLDSCRRTTPAQGQLCDIETERDSVRLLGTSANEIWYIVTVEEISSLDTGTGYRVVDVRVAGRS